MVNMKIHLGYVSASVAGDYYQVHFGEKKESDEFNYDDKYLLIQRQFEIPNGNRICIASHNENFVGYFKGVKARLNPESWCLTLNRKKHANIEVTFKASPKIYKEVKRVLKVMIPNIEIENEIPLTSR